MPIMIDGEGQNAVLGLLACDEPQPYQIVSSLFDEISGGAVLGDSFCHGRREKLLPNVTWVSWTRAWFGHMVLVKVMCLVQLLSAMDVMRGVINLKNI